MGIKCDKGHLFSSKTMWQSENLDDFVVNAAPIIVFYHIVIETSHWKCYINGTRSRSFGSGRFLLLNPDTHIRSLLLTLDKATHKWPEANSFPQCTSAASRVCPWDLCTVIAHAVASAEVGSCINDSSRIIPVMDRPSHTIRKHRRSIGKGHTASPRTPFLIRIILNINITLSPILSANFSLSMRSLFSTCLSPTSNVWKTTSFPGRRSEMLMFA